MEINSDNVQPKWNGQIRDKPTREKVVELILVVEYFLLKKEFKQIDFYGRPDSPATLNKDKFGNSRKADGPFFSIEEYNYLANFTYEFLVDKKFEYKNLRSLDDYIKPLVRRFYPQLESIISEFDGLGLIFDRADSDPRNLERVRDHFMHGAYTIRYASNESDTNTKDIAFAKGYLKVHEAIYTRYLTFQILYETEGHRLDITGRIYLLNGFLIFLGVEEDDPGVFLMVMHNDMTENRHGGLIIRMHKKSGDTRRYFASRVMIYRNKSSDQNVPDAYGNKARDDLPELEGVDLEALMNIAEQNGMSVLFRKPIKQASTKDF